MASVNPLTREITLKVVYYGPGLGGKTTTLQYIHDTSDSAHRGKMVSLATPVDRTLYFDFLPVRLPKIGGYTLRLQLFTVPGQVHFNATRKLVLTNADGVVFVADSQPSRREANIESVDNLQDNLAEHRIEIADFPLIFQMNKQDIKDILPTDQMSEELNQWNAPTIPTCALTGDGVYIGLEKIIKKVLRELKDRDVLARRDKPISDEVAKRIAFGKSDSGLTSMVQEYSEERNPRTAIKMSDLSSQVEPDKHAVTIVPPSQGSLQNERPTIPAPANTGKTLPPEMELLDGKTKRDESAPLLSFVPLWPAVAESRAKAIETAISSGQNRAAIQMIWKEMEDITKKVGRGVPDQSAQSIVGLLGIDGRQYLRLANLAKSESEISPATALDSYLFLLQAFRQVDN
jgi:mutual gliding-motility protein MglA